MKNGPALAGHGAEAVRDAIEAGRFEDFRRATKADWARGDIEPIAS